MPEDDFDPWRTLGVPVGAEPPEIRRAFRRLARRMHPDVSRDPKRAHEQFIRLRQAYETLMDDEMRSALEAHLLQDDAETLIIIDDLDVTLDDAYELLSRGYVEEARQMYIELARQHPGDPRLLELLETIQRVEASADVRTGTHQAPSYARHRETYRDLWVPEPIAIRWWMVSLAAMVIAGCAWAVRALDAPPLIGPYALAEIGLSAAAGLVGAMLVAGSGLLGSFDLELGGFVGDTRYNVPLWLYLAVAGIVSPILALIFYLVCAALQEEWSWSVAGFFAASFALTAVLGRAHGGDLGMTMLVGSNAVFVPGLVGWALGSIFRPGYWWE